MNKFYAFILLLISASLSAQTTSKFEYFKHIHRSSDVRNQQTREFVHIIGDNTPDETLIITTDTVFTGDMAIINEGSLILEDSASMTLNGNLVIIDNSSIQANNADFTLKGNFYAFGHAMSDMDSCFISLPMDYRYQYALIALDTTALSFTNSHFDFGNGLLNGYLDNHTSLNMERDTFAQTVTMGLSGHAELNLSHVYNAWEFIFEDSCTASFDHCTNLILWFHFPHDATASYSFPPSVWVDSVHFNNTVAGLEEIPYSVEIDSCYNVNWGMFPMAGSDVTIINSDMRTCGFIFDDGEEHTVSSLMNEQFYTDETINIDDRNLHLINSQIRTWNLYTMDTSVLNINGCLFGEALSMQSSTINVTGGICDGSGGYLGTENSTMNCFSSKVECQILMEKQSSGGFMESEIYYPWDEHVFAEHTIVVMANTTHNQDFSVRDTSFLVELYLDTLNNQSINDVVDIRGTARSLAGQECPYSVTEYRIFYALADNPDNLTLIAEGLPGEIQDAVITEWNTDGLSAGNYILFLEAIVNGNYDEPVRIPREVNLYDLVRFETENKNIPAIWPNPAKNKLNIHIPGNQSVPVSIVDMLGKTWLQEKLSGEFNKLEICKLPVGQYIITVGNFRRLFQKQ
ncbi:MAG: T9SS type A sorting domain-containing protein [Bacteroidota bacterium]|nr:T9SS type A sorting domain-containing protein [Bacteroidota bacterium]